MPVEVQCCNPESKGITGRQLVRRSRCGKPEEASDERGLPLDVILCQPLYLPLVNHVHRFDTLKRSPRRVKGPEALTCLDPSFDCPMVLFD